MRDSYRVGSILGIPVELHISFVLLLLLVFIYSLAVDFQAFIYLVLLFTVVTLHELSHSVVAKRYGIGINRITLLPFGGIASMEELPSEPGQELKIAIAGPGFNFLMSGLSLLALYMLDSLALVFPLFDFSISAPVDLLAVFFKVNLLLGAFNLFVPALPMDGGRVFRSLLALKLGFHAATEIATSIAKVIAVVFALLGVMIPNLWLVFIAFFVYLGAVQESEMLRINFLLSGIKVRDLMSRGVVWVHPDMTLEELAEVMLERKHMGYPVLTDGRLIGIVTFTDLSKVPRSEWSRVRVGEVMSRNLITTTSDADASEAFLTLAKAGVGRLPVVDGGELKGILSKTDLLRAIEVMRLKRLGG